MTTFTNKLRITKLAVFLAAGLPTFIAALALNYGLVEYAGLAKSMAYALTIFMQITANYFICRCFVFRKEGARASLKEYITFISGILIIRMLDWTVYVILVSAAGLYYLTAQVLNVIIFAVIKYGFSERLMR